ncbi:mitochondrial glycoprotein [Bombardia bombarda]|uniref:Mitochondrial glycoprotein n=1 Tax=Bombardia bombarda TaxID=252184 RepID=A0AA39X1N8_9PEZI|nr:mitochondrial glycoprotein [Bombardia bombarda]
MMSLRALARSAPRALSRASSSTMGRSTQSAMRTIAKTQSAAFLRPQQASAFSTTLFRRAATSSETDEELSAKLASEIEFEQDVKENEPMPASIKDFIENGPFEIQDTPGKEDVILTRTYGNEKITVSFSIADLHNYEQENDMYDEDGALADEELDGPKSNQRSEADEEADEEDLGGNAEPDVPVRLTIVVEKPSKGALTIEAVAQDGAVVVENLFYYKDAKLAHGASPDATHAAQDAYPGPPFGSLDEDLQVLMERYLEDRGITQALAAFVPEYMDMKEQREYLAWLNNVKGFIDA